MSGHGCFKIVGMSVTAMLAFVTMTAGDAYAGMGPHGEADNSEVGDEALTATRLGKRQRAGNRGMGVRFAALALPTP